MSRNLSAVKKKQISLRNKLLNKIYRSSIRTLVKKCLTAIKDDNKQSVHYLSAAYSKIDKAIKKRVVHKNEGARKKAALNRVLKQRARCTL